MTSLSLLEMRECFGNNEKIAPVESNKKKINFVLQYKKYIELTTYYSKNCFYFFVDEFSTFGTKGGNLTFAPSRFDYGNWVYKNAKYRLYYLQEHIDEIDDAEFFIKLAEERLNEDKENNDKLEINNLNSFSIL